MVLECMATHTGTDNSLCCIPSQQAEVSSASADAELRHYAWAAPEGVVGEECGMYGVCGECEAPSTWYALVRIAAGDGIQI